MVAGVTIIWVILVGPILLVYPTPMTLVSAPFIWYTNPRSKENVWRLAAFCVGYTHHRHGERYPHWYDDLNIGYQAAYEMGRLTAAWFNGVPNNCVEWLSTPLCGGPVDQFQAAMTGLLENDEVTRLVVLATNNKEFLNEVYPSYSNVPATNRSHLNSVRKQLIMAKEHKRVKHKDFLLAFEALDRRRARLYRSIGMPEPISYLEEYRDEIEHIRELRRITAARSKKRRRR